MAEALISTAVGEFSSSYLAKEAGKNIAQFIAKYGSAAFQRVAPLVTGGMILEAAVEAYPDVDLQKEKLFGTPLSSLPGMPTGPVYSDIEEPKKVEPLKYIDTVHGGKGPLPPIKAKPFPAETEVKKWDESFKAPKPIETTKGLEVPPQEKIVLPGFETPKTVDTSILFNKEYTDEEFYNESIKQKKGSRFLDRIHNNDVFKDLNFPNDTYEELEAKYAGDINDLGDAKIAQVFLLPYTNLYEDYFEDYKQRLADIAEEELGKEFFVYRVMHKNEALNWFKSGDLPLIKETVYDEETGEETRKIFKLEGIGGEHGMAQEAMGFSLNPYTALGFRHLTAFSGVDVIPEKDLVIVKAKVASTDIVMRGNKSEQEVVFNVGELRAGKELTLYDFKEVKDEIGKQYALTENLDYIIKAKDITKQTEELVKKELSASQQTKNLTSKIKNEITTWEDHFPTIEEATKAAKDVGGTLREFEEGLIEKKITFRKLGTMGGQYFKVLYDGKEIAELAPLEKKYKGIKEYNIKFMGEIDASDTGTGLAESKALVKKYIVEGLLDKSEPTSTPGLYWEPLRKTFQEATFDKKGNYVEFPEPAHTEKELEELVEQVNKNK